MTPQHSPGPWVNDNGVIYSEPLDTITMVQLKDDPEPVRHHTHMVAIAYGQFIDHYYNHDDNAQLIAAAPELLASLKALLGDIESGLLVRDITRDGDPNWSAQMLDFVRRLQAAQAAVAKAEGRQP